MHIRKLFYTLLFICREVVYVCKQVNRLLKALQRDPNETDSDHSGDGSNTDSGRGPSEEGESARMRLMAGTIRGQRL